MNAAKIETCLACGARMEAGFVVDGIHAGASTVAQWFSGDPAFNRFGILKARSLRNTTALATTTSRCVECGRLEFYAR